MDIYTSPKTSVCRLGQVRAAVYQEAIKVLFVKKNLHVCQVEQRAQVHDAGQ